MKKLTCYDKWTVGLYSLLFFCAFSCASPEKIAERQRKARDKALADHIQLIKETRAELPCDTITTVVTKTDTTFVFVSDTTYSHDTAFITKQKVVTNTVYRTNTVVDSAQVELWKDRYEQAGNLLENANNEKDKIAIDNQKKDLKIKSLQGWKTYTLIGLIGLAVGGAFMGISKLKSFFL